MSRLRSTVYLAIRLYSKYGDLRGKTGFHRDSHSYAGGPRVCGFCGDYADELRCGACKMRFYCSEVCQREEWKYHKAECRRVR